MEARNDLGLQVQVVLYRNHPDEVRGLVCGLISATNEAARQFPLTANLALGDCSEVPHLSNEQLQALKSLGQADVFTGVSYEHFNENIGSAGGSNRLAAGTQNDLLLVINPDTYPTPTLLLNLVTVMEDPAVGIAEARQFPLEHPKEYDLASGDTSWASGCCMLIRRKAFDEVGGFDAVHFPLYCDDVDLSWRVRLAGYRVVHVPKAAVFHNKQISLSGTPVAADTEIYHGTLARLMLATKYDRPDIANETILLIRFKQHAAQLKALAEFEARQELGAVPAPVDGARKVAQFIDGEYARHRF